jgi:glycosyltransferase involved in cell wall biosynthesis
MKIAMLTHYWNSPEGGGINTHVTGLVRELRKVPGVEINVVYVKGSKGDHQVSDTRCSMIFGTISALKKIRPDVINIRQSWPLLIGSAIYCRFNKKTKLIFTFHTEPPEKKGKKKRLANWALNKCDIVAFISKSLEKRAVEHWKLDIRTRKVITYAGVEPKTISQNEINEFLNKFKLKKEDKKILIQGFTATKMKAEGVKLALNALKKVIETHPDVRLIITREGAYSKELEKFAKEINVFDKVRFTGTLDNPYVALETCDIFLWPWLGEMGTGMALLEALAMGKPIIATPAHGSLEPLDQNNALLVKPSIDGLVKGIITLIDNPELVRMMAKNTREIADRFPWGNSVKRHLEIYGMKEMVGE